MRKILLETREKRILLLRVESFTKFYSYVASRTLNDETVLPDEKRTKQNVVDVAKFLPPAYSKL